MKHILMVEASLTGAGLQVLRYCLKQTYHVTLLTSNLRKYEDLCIQLASEYSRARDLIDILEVNTSDYLLLYSKAKELSSSVLIDGVFTTSDIHVPQTCFLAEQFHTKWLSYDGAVTARDKFQMRRALELKDPSLNPYFCVALSFDDAKSKVDLLGGYPFIAKPRNSNDSIGVVRISNESDLYKYFQDYTSKVFNLSGVVYSDDVLLESYIDGQEYSIETLHRGDGKPIILGISQKNDFGGKILQLEENNIEPGNYTELSLSFPISSTGLYELAKKISQALPLVGVDYGIIHTEFKINTRGQVKVLEVNPRLAGDMLGSHCVPFATGIDTAKALVELALGNIDAVPCVAEKQHGAAIIGIYADEEGRFLDFANLSDVESFLSREALNYQILVWKKQGEQIKPPKSNADLLGRIAVEAPTVEEALLLCRRSVMMLQINYIPQTEKAYSSLFSLT